MSTAMQEIKIKEFRETEFGSEFGKIVPRSDGRYVATVANSFSVGSLFGDRSFRPGDIVILDEYLEFVA